MTIKTPAKINLGLRVVDRRSDGYHDIRTTFQTIGLFDKIRVTMSEESDSLRVEGPVTVESGPDNLLIRTLNYLRGLGFEVPGLEMVLHKRIPTEAGLGGGSSNAAGLIRMIDELIDAPVLDQLDSESVARQIGADVPFFLRGGTVRGEGIGHQLRGLKNLQGYVLVAVPPHSISTEEAYGNLEISPGKGNVHSQFEVGYDNLFYWKEMDLSNDFEEQLNNQFELHKKLRATLSDRFEKVGLSGSGSALYALSEEESVVNDFLEELRGSFDSTKFYCAKLLTRNEQPTVLGTGS